MITCWNTSSPPGAMVISFWFGRTATDPFNGKNLQGRGDTAWTKACLNRITPHECRHTFASLMIAAGVNAKAISTFMGHANIAITLDRHGHLMPGSEGQAGGLLDRYLAAQRESAEEAARSAGDVQNHRLSGERVRAEKLKTA